MGALDNPQAFNTLEIRRREDLLWVTLNNPGKANALAPRMIAEITELYRRPLLDEGIRAVLLRGAGKHFSAGADLEHLRSLRDAALQLPEEVPGPHVAGRCDPR